MSYFSDACFLTCFVNLSSTNFLCQRHPRASISNVFGRHLEHILNKCGKVETAILCGRVLKNQALEGLCLTLFCHFHVQVFGTSFFHDSFDDLSPFYTFVHPLEAHFLQHFAIISTIIFKHAKNRKIGLDPESRRVHLRHIKGKGGTGKHLGGIWEAPGRLWESSSAGWGLSGILGCLGASPLVECEPLLVLY